LFTTTLRYHSKQLYTLHKTWHNLYFDGQWTATSRSQGARDLTSENLNKARNPEKGINTTV